MLNLRPYMRSRGLLESDIENEDDRVMQCTVCEYRCKKGDDLDKHLLSHKNEKPFKCNKCDDSFESRIDLDFHMENHSDVTVIDLSYASIVNSPVRHWTSSISSNQPPVLRLTALKKRAISTSPEGMPSNKQQATGESHSKSD